MEFWTNEISLWAGPYSRSAQGLAVCCEGTTVGGKGSSERRVVVFMNIVKSIIEL